MASIAEEEPAADAPGKTAIPRYAYYTLGVLLLANVFNYIDRQIPSIIAEAIKHDLKLDDAQLGFLMGTAFAVFYAVVGIAMGRISDGVPRRKLMALGLTLWSGMTALGGVASTFTTLSLAHIGVGIGEATATPCSVSMLTDSFPARNRAVVIGTWLTGTFIGTAVSLAVGGYIVQHWVTMCGSVPIAGACGVANWQATLIAVGLPGLLLAILVYNLREPPRAHAQPKKVGRFVLSEFAAAIPPFTMLTLYRMGGTAALLWNVVLAVALGAIAYVVAQLTGDTPQWSAIALGAYAVVTWGQNQKYRDPPLYRLTFGCPTFLLGVISAAFIAAIGGAMSAWAAPYAIRTLGLSPSETGLSLGLLTTGAAVIGALVGGTATDRWKRRDQRAPAFIGAIAVLGGLPSMIFTLAATESTPFFVGMFIYALTTSIWGGAFAALAQDLVLPRMRGAAASAFALVSIVVASSTGPYWAGKVSAVTGSLKTGILSMQLLLPIVLILLFFLARRLGAVSPEGRRARAEAAGEPALSAT